ncbi:hypothetical protein [Actinocrispum sp. NPDC049592]|uniref:hypothetical protein n=1 Tax=Actinocrispum sp. NPDC049592 TaxID=3154835 RepID=UPI003413068F
MTRYQGLGFDPVPGSPDAVMAASERCTHAVGALPAFRHDTDTWWTGAAGEAFAGRMRGLPGRLTEVRQVLSAMAEVLDEWAATLLANQRRAEHLDQRALRLRGAIRTTSDDVGTEIITAQLNSGPDAEQRRRDAVTQHESLLRELDAVLKEARTLERDHLTAARRVAERLRALDTGGVEAAAQIHDRAELFDSVMSAVAAQSGFAGDLAGLLFGRRGARTEPARGAAAAFVSALVP